MGRRDGPMVDYVDGDGQRVYPEHEKMRTVTDASQVIGEFLDLGPYTLCEYVEGRLVPVSKSIQQVLADYFEIDLDAIESEKRIMLRQLREAQEEK